MATQNSNIDSASTAVLVSSRHAFAICHEILASSRQRIVPQTKKMCYMSVIQDMQQDPQLNEPVHYIQDVAEPMTSMQLP